MIAYLSLLFDSLLVLLLVATIVYASRLHKRLNLLRSSRDELLATVEAFFEATERAETAVKQLKEATRTNANELQTVIQRAKDIRDDLAGMVTQGENLANRLETGAENASKSLQERHTSQASASHKTPASDKAARADFARELAQKLGATPHAPPPSYQEKDNRPTGETYEDAAEAERLREESQQVLHPNVALKGKTAGKQAPVRSKAEQELLSALGRRS